MPTLKELDSGQLEFMWNFIKMGEQKSSPEDVKRLKNNLDDLRQLLIQKTGGQEQYKKFSDVPMEDAGTIVNIIVMETMSLYLSGALDKLEEILRRNKQ